MNLNFDSKEEKQTSLLHEIYYGFFDDGSLSIATFNDSKTYQMSTFCLIN